MEEGKGWIFVDRGEPLYGAKYLRELYFMANPNYEGRFTVPVLWDKKKGMYLVLHLWPVMKQLTVQFSNHCQQ